MSLVPGDGGGTTDPNNVVPYGSGFGNPADPGAGAPGGGNSGSSGTGLTPEDVARIIAQNQSAADAQAYWDNYVNSGGGSKSGSRSGSGSVRSSTPTYQEGPDSGQNKWSEFLLTLQQNQADLAEKQRQANQTNLTAEERLSLDRQIQSEQKTIQEEKNQVDRGTLQETVNRDNMNSVDSLQKGLMSETGPEDTFRYLFNSRGYQAPRGYAAAPLPMTNAQRSAMGLGPGQQYVPGNNQDNPLAYLGSLPPSLQPAPGQSQSFAPTGGAGYGQQPYGQQGYGGQQPSPWMGINNAGNGGISSQRDLVQYPGPQGVMSPFPNNPPQGLNLLTPHTGALDSTLTGDYSWMWRDPANPGAGWQFGEPPKGSHIEWTQTPQDLMHSEQAGGQNPWGTGKVDPNGWLGAHGYATSGQQNAGGGYLSGMNWNGGVDGGGNAPYSQSGFGQPPYVPPYQYPGAQFQNGAGAQQSLQVGTPPQSNPTLQVGTPPDSGRSLQVGAPYNPGGGSSTGRDPNVDYSNTGQPIGFKQGYTPPQSNPTLQVGTPPDSGRTLQVGTPPQSSPMIGAGSTGSGQYGGGSAISGLPDFSKIGNLPPFLQGLANQTSGGPQFVKPSMQQWGQMNNSEQGAYGSALGDLSGINRKDVIDKIPDQTQGMSASPGASDVPTKFS